MLSLIKRAAIRLWLLTSRGTSILLTSPLMGTCCGYFGSKMHPWGAGNCLYHIYPDRLHLGPPPTSPALGRGSSLEHFFLDFEKSFVLYLNIKLHLCCKDSCTTAALVSAVFTARQLDSMAFKGPLPTPRILWYRGLLSTPMPAAELERFSHCCNTERWSREGIPGTSTVVRGKNWELFPLPSVNTVLKADLRLTVLLLCTRVTTATFLKHCWTFHPLKV